MTKDPLSWGPDDPRGFGGSVSTIPSLPGAIISAGGVVSGPLSTTFSLQGTGAKAITYAGSSNPSLLQRYQYVFNNPVMLIDPWGLWTAGIGVTFSAGAGSGGGRQIMFVWDDDGNVGISSTEFFGAYAGLSASVTVTGQFTTADTIRDLRGWSWSGGASYSFPGGYTVGAEYIRGSNYNGFDISPIGIGAPAGYSGWSFANYTEITKL